MSEVWTLDEGLKKKYEYDCWYTAIGPWTISITHGKGYTTFGIELEDRHGDWEDTIGEAPTLHAAKKKALEWVLEQMRIAAAEVKMATMEWQVEEERGEV